LYCAPQAQPPAHLRFTISVVKPESHMARVSAPYVITASKWQVRQRMHAASAGRWRHYEKHAAPLRRLVSGDV
jgi:hypothetical protein